MRHREMENERAAFLAIHAYYTCLAGMAGRAIERNTMVPEVPPLSELDVVDGWIVRKNRPLWSVDDHAFGGAQLGWTGLSAQAARSAWTQAAEYRLQVTRMLLDHTSECLKEIDLPPERKARLLAEIGYFGSVIEEHRRALRGEAPFPRVPQAKKLEFVNGWLVWNSQPVWWSGHRAGSAAPLAISAHPAEASAGAGAPLPQRPRLRRLLALPWRRAAA